MKEGYTALLVEMKDGKQFTGIKVRETAKELVLRDAEDKEVVLAVDTGRLRPAIIEVTVPDNQNSRLPDINQVIRSVRVVR